MVKIDEIDQAILEATARYRVLTRTSVPALLGCETVPDKRLTRLTKEGLLRCHKKIAIGGSIYQLTKRGAGQANVSPARGRVMGSQSLLKNIGVLLFCLADLDRRKRVEADAVASALNADLPDGAYCVCRVKDVAVAFECYVPAPQTPIDTVVSHLRRRLKAVQRSPTLRMAAKDLRFGFAIVVPNPQRRKAIMDAVRTCGAGEKVPLIKRVRIRVEAAEELEGLFGTARRRLGSSGSGATQTVLFTSE